MPVTSLPDDLDAPRGALDGRYDVQRLLATGGTGSVHLGRDTTLDRLALLVSRQHNTPERTPMASSCSFDISTGADLQEVDNAVNQARKEIQQRYDFKGSKAEIDFDRTKAELKLAADDEFKMDALTDVLQQKMVKRGVPLKNLSIGEVEMTGSTARRTITLTQGIAGDVARKIQKAIRDGGFRKVQASIQGDELRVTSPSRDELQAVIQALRGQDFGIELKFGNFRG